MAHLLCIPERADWRACVGSDSEESTQTEAFRTAFSSFDFT